MSSLYFITDVPSLCLINCDNIPYFIN